MLFNDKVNLDITKKEEKCCLDKKLDFSGLFSKDGLKKTSQVKGIVDTNRDGLVKKAEGAPFGGNPASGGTSKPSTQNFEKKNVNNFDPDNQENLDMEREYDESTNGDGNTLPPLDVSPVGLESDKPKQMGIKIGPESGVEEECPALKIDISGVDPKSQVAGHNIVWKKVADVKKNIKSSGQKYDFLELTNNLREMKHISTEIEFEFEQILSSGLPQEEKDKLIINFFHTRTKGDFEVFYRFIIEYSSPKFITRLKKMQDVLDDCREHAKEYEESLSNEVPSTNKIEEPAEEPESRLIDKKDISGAAEGKSPEMFASKNKWLKTSKKV